MENIECRERWVRGLESFIDEGRDRDSLRIIQRQREREREREINVDFYAKEGD